MSKSVKTTTKQHYIWLFPFSILGVWVSFYLLHDKNPPLIVTILSSVSTGIIGGIIGLMIGIFIVNQQEKRKVQE